MDKMIIACSCDNGYAVHCGTMLTSVLENNKNHEIEIYILTDFIDEENRRKFDALSEQYCQEIHIVDIDMNLFKDLPYMGDADNNSLAAYYRLLIPQVVPDSVEKILYLDCDIIVRDNFYELWSIDLDGFAFAAAEDAFIQIDEFTKRLCYPLSDSYYNSGVLLYNLTYLREMQFGTRIEYYCQNFSERIVLYDQDIINAIYHGKIKRIPVKWNVMDSFLFREPWINPAYKEELENALVKPYIIHYTGALKPWFKECHNPYKEEYWSYRVLSPWKEGKAVYKHKCLAAINIEIRYLIKKFFLSKTKLGKSLYRV